MTTPLHLRQKPDLTLDEARMLLRLQQHLDLISEDVFQRVIIADAHPGGWLVHAERPARSGKGWRTAIQGDPGFFDLVLVRGGLVLLMELKSEKGTLTEAQHAWQRAALGSPEQEEVGGQWLKVGVWRPSDWPQIEAALK